MAHTHISGTVLIQSFQRSSACFDAMESRLYQGSLHFYTQPTPLCWRHAFWAAAYVALGVVVGLLGSYVCTLF